MPVEKPKPAPAVEPTPICALCGLPWGQFAHDPLTGKHVHIPRCPR